MEDLRKVQEFFDRLKKVKIEPIRVSQKEAARLMNCTTVTVRHYAKICKIPLLEGYKVPGYYHLSGIKKMILRRDYNDYIRRFEKKYKAGFYDKKN